MKIYNKLKHNIECVDGYFKKAIIILTILLIIDLMLLYLVW